jgi:predicted ATPase
VAWLVEEAEKAAVFCAWEDLHWADPSTLDVLTLFLDQVPTTRLLAVLTFRPEFMPPWGNRSHLSQLTLNRLGRLQVEAMVAKVTGDKALPPEVVQQIVAKTDGVPLFIEELTKMVLESGLPVGAQHAAPLPALGIPTTLHDALMARLDRLNTAKEIAQLGATLGREFSYEVLHAVWPLDAEALQQGLRQLVEAELLYQRGLPPQASYLFKHALIQDTAYQSLLKSTRQQYHQQIAQVLEERFPETVEIQPELLAHHYTEAGLAAQAIRYWRKAGQRASERAAHMEAIAHFTKGLDLLKALPDTPDRVQQELRLQVALGPQLGATKGFAAPDTEHAYARARDLCRQVGETPWLFPVLGGLCTFYQQRGQFRTACELAEQLLRLAQSTQDPVRFVWAHSALGASLYYLGELVSAQGHLEQSLAFYDPQQRLSYGFVYDPKVICLSVLAFILWLLGYPDQALKRNYEALTQAQELSHSFSLATALSYIAGIHVMRGEWQSTQERAEAAMTLSADQGFPHFLALETVHLGWVLAKRGQREEGITQMRQGMAALAAAEAEARRSWILALLAEAYGEVGDIEEGLTVLAEALATVDKTGERVGEAELYRVKGELLLQSAVRSPQSEIPSPQHPTPSTQSEAEACFLKAIEIAQRQQAKSLELRAVMSLSRLWLSQGKKAEARQMLAEIYGWFTEGFDTKDLQEAKTLLEELT